MAGWRRLVLGEKPTEQGAAPGRGLPGGLAFEPGLEGCCASQHKGTAAGHSWQKEPSRQRCGQVTELQGGGCEAGVGGESSVDPER